MARLSIANSVSDLIQGDVHEHLPLERIPLDGDVLGLGTTTSLDNGELTFLHRAGEGRTHVWMGQAHDGGVRRLTDGDGSAHFPYVCFSEDMSGRGLAVDLSALAVRPGERLQPLLQRAIEQLHACGALPRAPVYGVRLLAHWDSLIITVSSKLCLGEAKRNRAVAPSAMAGGSVYEHLPHFRLARSGAGAEDDPIRTLGPSLSWECCGFWDTEPERGRLTLPAAGAHLHLHGCSTDLRHGGHLLHEHGDTQLDRLERLVLYPFTSVECLGSDLAVEDLMQVHTAAGPELRFRVINRGQLDVSDVGVAVVVDDSYASHRYLRLPWLAAGDAESFGLPLSLSPGRHQIQVIADPQQTVIERQRGNNTAVLELQLP
ncbi:MAG: CARDB domain-containing protein [Prochlorococcaceae cyanobacterium]|jgi:hypothetical protein